MVVNEIDAITSIHATQRAFAPSTMRSHRFVHGGA
jgi:hypothetical protein